MVYLPYLSFACCVIFLHAAGVNSECHVGWHHFEESCYMFSTDALNWYLAESSCRGHGGRLAEVTTKAQSDYLISMVKLLKMVNSNDSSHDYWLGGRDDIIEGTWQWASTDRVFTYTAWGPGNPSNTGGNEDCLHLHDFPPEGIKWNDNACQVGMKFICEKPIDSDNPEIIG